MLSLNSFAQENNKKDYHSPLGIPLVLSSNFGELRPNHFQCDNWHPKMVGMYGRYDPKIFREFFIEGLQNPYKCFKRERKANEI